MDIHKEIEDCRNSTKECIEVMTAYAGGQLIEVRARDREGSSWLPADTPAWNFEAYEYRILPRETPSIDWSAVHRRYNYLVVDQFRQGLLFAAKPSVGGFGWEGAGGVVGKTAALFEHFLLEMYHGVKVWSLAGMVMGLEERLGEVEKGGLNTSQSHDYTHEYHCTIRST